MENVLKLFNNCINELEKEIEDIKEGLYDNNLDSILLSPPIKREYFLQLNKYCNFPFPPKIIVSNTSNNTSISNLNNNLFNIPSNNTPSNTTTSNSNNNNSTSYPFTSHISSGLNNNNNSNNNININSNINSNYVSNITRNNFNLTVNKPTTTTPISTSIIPHSIPPSTIISQTIASPTPISTTSSTINKISNSNDIQGNVLDSPSIDRKNSRTNKKRKIEGDDNDSNYEDNLSETSSIPFDEPHSIIPDISSIPITNSNVNLIPNPTSNPTPIPNPTLRSIPIPMSNIPPTPPLHHSSSLSLSSTTSIPKQPQIMQQIQRQPPQPPSKPGGRKPGRPRLSENPRS